MLDVGGEPIQGRVPQPVPPVRPQPTQTPPVQAAKVTFSPGSSLMLVLSVAGLLISGFCYLAVFGLTRGVEKNTRLIKDQIAKKEEEINSPKNQKVVKDLNRARAQYALYGAAVLGRANVGRLMEVLMTRLPKETDFDSISFDPEGGATLSGKAPDMLRIAKAYVSIRDYVMATFTSSSETVAYEKLRQAFLAQGKTDVIIFQTGEKDAAVFFSENKPDEFDPANNAVMRQNLGEWSMTKAPTKAFLEAKLASVSPVINDQGEGAEMEPSFSIAFKPSEVFFAQPFELRAGFKSIAEQKESTQSTEGQQ